MYLIDYEDNIYDNDVKYVIKFDDVKSFNEMIQGDLNEINDTDEVTERARVLTFK